MKSSIFTQLKSGIRVLTAMLLLGMHFHVSAQKTELSSEARSIPNFTELWANEPFAKYDPSTEIIEKRDQFSKHFQNADGTITAHIASGPINYWEDGQWKTIFHTIEKTENGYLSNLYNDFKTTYPVLSSGSIKTSLPNGNTFTDMQGMRMYYEANGQELLSINIAANTGKADFNVLTYPSVYGSDIDLRFTQNTTTRKMDYILQNASALNNAPSNAQFLVFEEKITLPEGTVAKLENNVIHLYQYGNIIAKYTNPYITEKALIQNNDIIENADMSVAIDERGEITNSEAETEAETLGENGRYEGKYDIVQTGNELTVKLKVEMAWLLDASRTFPIEVDPTTNYDVDGSVNSCAFSQLRPGNSTCWSVIDATGYFDVGRGSNVSGAGSNVTWLDGYNRFDISSLPSGSQVSSAKVYFTMYDRTSTNGLGTMALYEMDYNQTTNSCPDFYANMTATAYSADFSGTNISNGPGAHNLDLNATGVADLQAKVGTSWFALAYRATGTYSSSYRFRRMLGRNQAAKPYIAVTYTSATITATSTMTAFTSCPSTASSSQSFTVSGTNMAAGITVTAPAGFEVSTNNSTWSGDGGNITVGAAGTIANTTIYARMAAVASAPASGNIVCSSTSATSVNVAVSGSFFSVPTVTTTTASAVANFTATSGGNVTNDGGAAITARGVLWGTTPGLTMPSANSTSDGTGTGSFTSSIAGLSASTIYYYRAYAQNCSGYGYGPEYTFVTTGPASTGYYISGNIENNGEIISTFDENYLRMTGTSKTITGSGKFTDSKLFADGNTNFNATLDAASAFTETYVNAGKSLTISTGRTFKNGIMSNYGTLTINGNGVINNTSDWFNNALGTVTFGGSGTIYAGANWTNDGTFTAGTGTVEFNGSTSGNTINGTTAFYKATINKGSSTATILDVVGTVTQTNVLTFTNGLLRIPTGGSWTKTGSGPTIGATSGLHVNGGTFTQNGASITNNGLFKTTTGTASIGSSSGNSITNQTGSSFIIDGAGTVNIAGRLRTTSDGSFNQSAGTLNLCTSGNGSSGIGSLDMASGTSFTMSGGSINMVQKSTGGTQIDYKNLAGTVSISGGTLTIGTSATSPSSNFNIQGAMPPLIVDNTTNSKTATINGTSTVYGDVTINTSSTLVLNSAVTATVEGSLFNSGTSNITGSLNLAGNWTNTGTVTAASPSLVTFFGSSDQNVTSGGGSFANVTLNNTSISGYQGIVLQDAMTVNGALTFTDGNIQLGAHNLTIGASGTVVTPSVTSHVITASSGVVTKNTLGATEFIFPVGTSILSYTPVKLANSGTADNFSVYVTDNVLDGGTTGSVYNTGRVMKTWHVSEATGGGSSVTMTPYWTQADEDAQFLNSECGVSHYTSSAWDDPGIYNAATLSGGMYSISRGNIQSFSPFMVRRSDFIPLPITLSYFGGTCNPEGNEVMWVTSSEQNSSHFDLKRSYDGMNWEHVGQKQAAGNSATDIEYVIWDAEGSRHEVTYYELRQFDYNNDSAVYGPIAVRCENIDSDINGSLSPNPTLEASYLAIENCPLGEATITLMSSTGQIVYTDRIMVTKENDVYFIDSLDLTRGSYVIRFQAPNGQIVAMKLVKN